MLSASEYQPGIWIVFSRPLYVTVRGRKSRTIGFPVTGQIGTSAIFHLLDRKQPGLGYGVGRELDVENHVLMGTW
jgi:hypothetical protein